MSDPDGSGYGRRSVARRLAARLLAQPWTLSAIRTELAGVQVRPRTRFALAQRIFTLGDGTYPPAPPTIERFLVQSDAFDPRPDHAVGLTFDPPVFAPLPRFAGLPIPVLATPGDLATWLLLSSEELDWFSDARHGQDHAQSPRLLHYRHRLIRKGSQSRLLEAPKARLKGIQRRILREILAPVPVHDCAHGFIPGRSCLTGAQIHAGEAVVAGFDLEAFFPSIGAARVHGIFRSLGYPWAVARHLTGLCTAAVPFGVIDRMSEGHDPALRERYGVPHLPQGAPTSPALANLLAWRLDRRLHRLAGAAGANYTRYADDLVFSGDAAFARSLGRFGHSVTTIVAEEGFRLNPAKSRIMPRHQRQRVTGLVVNDHINVGRAEFDTLKAILHNCCRGDPAGQNRERVPDFGRHLDGRIAWVEQVNPPRGSKLRQVFERIAWAG